MAYCSNCKEEKPDDQKFCDNCGAELTAAAPTEPAAPASEPAATPPSQPVYSAEQFQQHKEQAIGIFSKLGLGFQIAAIGAIASFLFSLITIILGGKSVGAMGFYVRVLPGFTWLFMIVSAVAVILIYMAHTKTGKPRAMLSAIVMAIGAMWIPLFFGGLDGYHALFILAMIGGVAQAVGAFMDLNRNA